jgi:hypothetical protein
LQELEKINPNSSLLQPGRQTSTQTTPDAGVGIGVGPVGSDLAPFFLPPYHIPIGAPFLGIHSQAVIDAPGEPPSMYCNLHFDNG